MVYFFTNIGGNRVYSFEIGKRRPMLKVSVSGKNVNINEYPVLQKCLFNILIMTFYDVRKIRLIYLLRVLRL